MLRLLVLAAALALASANLSEVLAGGVHPPGHHHGGHDGEHHHGDHAAGAEDHHHEHPAEVAVAVPIVNQQFDTELDGAFTSGFEAANGIRADMSGENKVVDGDPEKIGIAMHGSYSYEAPDGQIITVTWVADERGFQPTFTK